VFVGAGSDQERLRRTRQDGANRVNDEVEVLLLHDKWRSQNGGIFGGLDVQAVIVETLLQLIPIHANNDRIDIDSGEHAVAAHIRHTPHIGETEGSSEKVCG
jgi:hypothetical protein